MKIIKNNTTISLVNNDISIDQIPECVRNMKINSKEYKRYMHFFNHSINAKKYKENILNDV